MEIMHPRCAGLDIHKDKSSSACAYRRRRVFTDFVESFGTTTKELLRLADWLTEHG